MKKGVVLSINKRFVTLLTPEGEFLKTKRQSRPYSVGEEISFSSKQKVSCSFAITKWTTKRKVVFSLASSFLMLISVLPTFFADHVSAYVTFDVNPSIELELNDELEVLNLTGLNRDGKLVIQEISDWKGKNVKTVTNCIVKTTKKLGYMEGKKQIVVSTTLLEDNKALDRNLKAEIKKVSRQRNFAQTDLKVIAATKNDRKKAKAQGISTGKFVEKKLEKDRESDIKEKIKESEVEKPKVKQELKPRTEIPENEAITPHKSVHSSVTNREHRNKEEAAPKPRASENNGHNRIKNQATKARQEQKEPAPRHHDQKNERPMKENHLHQHGHEEKAIQQKEHREKDSHWEKMRPPISRVQKEEARQHEKERKPHHSKEENRSDREIKKERQDIQ